MQWNANQDIMQNPSRWLEQQMYAIRDSRQKPRLLLHSCCAPCSSYVLDYLRDFFCITVFYDNPNISPQAEYEKRMAEQVRLLQIYNEMEERQPINFISGAYTPQLFFELVRGMEQLPEGGARCGVCYQMRLRRCAAYASQNGFDCFASTLSVSPHKNAAKLNKYGREAAQQYGVAYLFSDFKKKNGYQQSIAFSRQYTLYRQTDCGCVFSRKQTL